MPPVCYDGTLRNLPAVTVTLRKQTQHILCLSPWSGVTFGMPASTVEEVTAPERQCHRCSRIWNSRRYCRNGVCLVVSFPYLVHLLPCAGYLPLQCGCKLYGAAYVYTYTQFDLSKGSRYNFYAVHRQLETQANIKTLTGLLPLPVNCMSMTTGSQMWREWFLTL